MAEDVRVVKDNTAAVEAAIIAACVRAVDATEDAILEAIREAMEGPHSGATYGGHQASAPGEAPAKDTGEYLALTGKTEVAVHEGIVEGIPHTYADQAERLELGEGNVAARPMWHPIADQEAQAFSLRVLAEISRL